MKAAGLLELVLLLAWLAVSGKGRTLTVNINNHNYNYYNSPGGKGLLKLLDLANVGGFLGEAGGSLLPVRG